MIETGVVNGRFQVLNLKHMEYILAAKMKCSKLFIGINNPDALHTKESSADRNRSEKSANPFTYFERYEMLRMALREFRVPENEFDIIPFPINLPEYILQYAPKDATYFLGLYEEWDEEKLGILEGLGVRTEVLWRKTPEQKGVSSSCIRRKIALGEEWADYVPPSVYQYMKEHHLDERVRRLEKMRMDEKALI